MKDTEDEGELYFCVEKSEEVLDLLTKISYILFDDDGYNIGDGWQSGLPKAEFYTSYDKDGIYMGVILSKERVYVIIRGFPKNSADKKHIKKLVTEKYKFVKSKLKERKF